MRHTVISLFCSELLLQFQELLASFRWLGNTLLKYKMGKVNVQRLGTTYLQFQFSIFLLCTDELSSEMESASKDKGEEKTETSEINIPLRASLNIETEKRLKW